MDPLSPQFPDWLILLMALRKISTPVLCLLVLGILPLYAWTANTQRFWGDRYSKLEELERSERQWLTRSEKRKYEISETVEKAPRGFIPKGSQTTIFVEPASPRPNKPVPPTSAVSPVTISPIGY
ncbi:MAG: hypothetical protein HC934_00520 [Acaryochloridaceae cyanobacterium SU_2_1]|nr:hypothetical protein [Acaryochloridaceae cyanobacterium SU_2_1]NJM95640.1 hypothetical protein [Acaryochloridaceae cyanobacterium CSU_5_19]